MALNEISKNLHVAKVVNNNNDKKDGSVKISIPYMHEGIKEDFLPNALPFTQFLGGSNNHGVSVIPEVGSFVWVFFEDELIHKNPFYIAGVNDISTNPHTLFENIVKPATNAEGNYPHVKFIYAQNGICLAINTTPNEAEIIVYHPFAYLFIDKSGYFYYKDTFNNEIKIDQTGFRFKDTADNQIVSVGNKLVLNGNLEIEQ